MNRNKTAAIRLGLLAPLTGLVSIYAEDIARAGQIATNVINESGGLLGRELELVVADDGSLPESAVPAANRLVREDGCQAIIGNLLSNSRIAVADQVSVPLRIPYLNFSFYEGSIFNRYFFHFAALPNQQIDKMIPYMAEHFGMKMYFAGNNYEWPRGSIDAAKRSLERMGGETVGEQYLSLGVSEEEVEWVLDGVARSGADVFVPYFAGFDQLLILNKFYERGLKDHMAVVMGHYDEVMVSHLKPEVRQGLYSSNTYFMSVDTEENAAFIKRLKRYPGVDGIWPNGNGTLTNFGEATYNCVMAFAYAVRTAETISSEELVDALESLRLHGPQGEIIMDSDTHHAYVNCYLSICNHDGSFTIVEDFGCIAPDIPSRYRDLFAARKSKVHSRSPGGVSRLVREAARFQDRQNDIKRILDVADMAILAADSSGIITVANRGSAELFGYTEDELVGMPMRLLVPPHLRQRHDKLVKGFIDGESEEMRMDNIGERIGYRIGERIVYRKDGTFLSIDASVAKFRSGDDWVLVATLQDLTERKRTQEELTRQATHDPLTGLPNRALLHERITNALNRSRRREENVALLFVDLDGFKTVNDSYGHDAGDYLLKTISARLVERVRPGDTVARFAGDEFVVLCEYVSDPSGMASLAQRLNDAVRWPVDYDSTLLGVTASIGIALGHGTTHSADDLLRFADNAMYAVKESKRDGWRFFNESLQQAAHQRLAISNGLRFALERGEFHVVFQPIVNLESEAVSGVEALLRWNSPEGPVPPSVFIPIAEMNGNIVSIGAWVFAQACMAQRRLQTGFGDEAPYIAVNLSARQFADEHLIRTFNETIEATGADPTRLTLEITESSLMSDVSGHMKTLDELCRTGMKVAVDDFGTGYSSLAQLVRLNVDTLKIDRMFVMEVDKSDEMRAIVAAISRMAKSLGIRLVAEGIENEDQLNEVLSLGVQSGQGYLFSRPVPEVELLELLNQKVSNLEAGHEDVYFLVYASRSDASVDGDEIRNIQKQSQALNRMNRITGYLVYHQGVFIQYVEGPKDKVKRLYRNISRDTRHHDVTLLAEGTSVKRLFLGWAMGSHRLDGNDIAKLAGFDHDTEALFEKYKGNPELCLSFFELVSRAI
jgi:diguanylate cyclase (GGDEF)-like protein/PAS domain S-box-containing protein